jgi:hypothetical protein
MKYEVNIDFDEASNAWLKNKTRLSNGCYQYKKIRCTQTTKKGHQCKKYSTDNSSKCTIHR